MKIKEGRRPEIKAELDKIARTRGGLTPEAVVQSAKAKHSPLHQYFTWDDSEAAAQWRLRQAATLIRDVTVVIERPAHKPVEVRAYINTREPDKAGCINLGARGKYTPIDQVLSEKEKREQMLSQAVRDLKAFRIKYAILDELARVWAEVDKLSA